MKKNVFLLTLSYCLAINSSVSGQQPTCNNPVGIWQNQANSTLTILSVDSNIGEFKGTYRSTSGAGTTIFPVTGWINISSPVAGKNNVTPISFTARWEGMGIIQSWTGYCREEGGKSTITTIWHLVRANSDSSWDHALAGTDLFAPGANSQVISTPDTIQVRGEAMIGRNTGCPRQGRDKQGNDPKPAIFAVNLLKNRDSRPLGSNFDLGATLTKMLNSNDDSNLFDQHKAATITGVLFDVRQERGETCNCNSTDPNDWDFHIYISNGNAQSIFDCAVIEITPYSRRIHPDWTLDFVKSLKKKKVKVTGWLLYDFEHTGQSFGTNPNTGARNRHTVWEIHPVTDLTVVNN